MMISHPLTALQPAVRQALENLHQVIPREADGREEVIWCFLRTDNLGALVADPAALRRRYPADRFAVTVLVPTVALQARAVENLVDYFAGMRVFELGDMTVMQYCRNALGAQAEVPMEVKENARRIVFFENRHFVAEKLLQQFDQEDAIDYEIRDALKVETVVGGIVHPFALGASGKVEDRQYGGVTDANLGFIELSGTHRTPGRLQNIEAPPWYVGAPPGLDKNAIEHVDEDVVFLGPLSKHYGHFILEGIARLWFFLDEANLKYKAVYLAEPGPERFNDMFTLFGISPDRLIRITKPTSFRSVIVPQQSMQIQDRVHRKWKETVDRILRDVPPSPYKKVYFSKEARNNFRGMGERPLEEIFTANGYQVFYPERLSMLETLSVLKGADAFAASSGTNAHNAIFLRDGVTSICLNRSPHVHYIQTMIDRLRGLDAWYVEANVSILPADWSVGPFLFGPTRHLLTFFGAQGFAFDAQKFIDEFPAQLIEFIKVWGMYYNDPERKTHIEEAAKTIPFDDLVATVVETFAHMRPQQTPTT